MLSAIIGLAVSLIIILISCDFFTNGIEWLGKKLNLGEGVVGSIFSAVGTCLPETIIPVIAILFSKGLKDNEDIGIGAILGAPFMLSTLAFFVTGLSVLIFWKRRKTGMKMSANNKVLGRDLGFFILVYILGVGVSFVDLHIVKIIVAFFLLACYVFYIYRTVKCDNACEGDIARLYIARLLRTNPYLIYICFQIFIALTGILVGAQLFVRNLNDVSALFGVPALILSLIITPIATELPEKFNSILWISRKKDTLALGNVSGAMVFQSCIPVSIGILATPWKLDRITLVSAVIAVLSAGFTFLWIKTRKNLNPIPLLAGGVFYIIFILYLIYVK
ncbi:MAG: sodium:calcium antiporter [Clostridia bacterium]|jgi:cation:H+ antiporter